MLTRLKINWKYKVWIFFLALLSCSEKTVDYGFGEYYVEIVTALEDNAFRLDSGQTVYDSNKTAKNSFTSGDRVYLYFSYGNTLSDPITVHGASKIFSDALKTASKETISQQTSDPFYFVSSWIGGNYLNLHLYFEFRSQAHKLSLVVDEKQINDSEIHLYLRHDINGDAPGYPTSVYASFNLSTVLGVPKGERNLFVHFNTTNYGDKIFTFKY